jgi:hypothetical protein
MKYYRKFCEQTGSRQNVPRQASRLTKVKEEIQEVQGVQLTSFRFCWIFYFMTSDSI